MNRAFAALALAGLILGSAAPGATTAAPAPGEAAAEHERQEAALRDLRARVATLQQELARGEEEKSDATDAMRESERAISETARALSDLATTEAALTASLAEARAALARIEGEQATHRQAIARLVVEQYRRRFQEPLQLLLAGGDPAEVRRHLRYLRTLNGARLAALAAAGERSAAAAALQDETTRRLAELGALRDATAAKRADLERERKSRQALLAGIAGQLAARRREIGAAQRDETRIGRLLARLEALMRAPVAKVVPPPHPRTPRGDVEATSDMGPLLRYKGLLKFPASGELVQRFGVPADGGGPARKGWFIRAPAGTPVQAVAAGTVVFADWLRGFGNLVIVDHGDGFMSLYGNNDSLLRQVGAQVEAGQAVAAAGSSGGAENSGVYFELRHNGIAFDPAGWFGRQ